MAGLGQAGEGKVALVTGAGAGIGRAVALRLAETGATVVSSDVDVASGEETAHLIESGGGTATFCKADVSVPEEVEALVRYCTDIHGHLDWACNNAGVLGLSAPMVEYTIADFDQVIAINLRSVFLCMHYQLPVMLARNTGAIVNICSEASIKGGVASCAYTAAKHGAYGLTKSAALEVAETGVRVNGVGPGIIHTGIVDRVTPEKQALAKEMMPSKRYGQPREIAEAVQWLMSDAASLVNGHLLLADSGWAAS